MTRCLQKDQRQRLRDIGDARIVIEETLARPEHDDALDTPRQRRPPRPPGRTGGDNRDCASGAAADLRCDDVRRTLHGRRRRCQQFRSPVSPWSPRPLTSSAPAISPDGKWVAYLSNVRGPTDVWVKFDRRRRRRESHGRLQDRIRPRRPDAGLDRWARRSLLTAPQLRLRRRPLGDGIRPRLSTYRHPARRLADSSGDWSRAARACAGPLTASASPTSGLEAHLATPCWLPMRTARTRAKSSSTKARGISTGRDGRQTDGTSISITAFRTATPR